MRCAVSALGLLAATTALAQAPAQVALGSYECWAWGSPRMLLNLKVTAPGRYTDPDGSKKGSFVLARDSGLVTFKGGHLDGAMPDNFTAVYHEKNNKPTISFRGASGSEASFCERVGR